MSTKNLFFITTITIILLFVLSVFPDLLNAQPPPVLPEKPTQTPVDGGLGLLAAAGGAYAVKKLNDRKK